MLVAWSNSCCGAVETMSCCGAVGEQLAMRDEQKVMSAWAAFAWGKRFAGEGTM